MKCHRCQEIIDWLHNQETGNTIRCPLCGMSYRKGIQWVLNNNGEPVNEDWRESIRPAYCTNCGWRGAMSDIVLMEGLCFPFRCPSCNSWISNRLGEEWVPPVNPLTPLSTKQLVILIAQDFIEKFRLLPKGNFFIFHDPVETLPQSLACWIQNYRATDRIYAL